MTRLVVVLAFLAAYLLLGLGGVGALRKDGPVVGAGWLVGLALVVAVLAYSSLEPCLGTD